MANFVLCRLSASAVAASALTTTAGLTSSLLSLVTALGTKVLLSLVDGLDAVLLDLVVVMMSLHTD